MQVDELHSTATGRNKKKTTNNFADVNLQRARLTQANSHSRSASDNDHRPRIIGSRHAGLAVRRLVTGGLGIRSSLGHRPRHGVGALWAEELRHAVQLPRHGEPNWVPHLLGAHCRDSLRLGGSEATWWCCPAKRRGFEVRRPCLFSSHPLYNDGDVHARCSPQHHPHLPHAACVHNAVWEDAARRRSR